MNVCDFFSIHGNTAAAVDKLAEAGIIDSPDRWKQLNFTENSVRMLIIKMAAALK